MTSDLGEDYSSWREFQEKGNPQLLSSRMYGASLLSWRCRSEDDGESAAGSGNSTGVLELIYVYSFGELYTFNVKVERFQKPEIMEFLEQSIWSFDGRYGCPSYSN